MIDDGCCVDWLWLERKGIFWENENKNKITQGIPAPGFLLLDTHESYSVLRQLKSCSIQPLEYHLRAVDITRFCLE